MPHSRLRSSLLLSGILLGLAAADPLLAGPDRPALRILHVNDVHGHLGPDARGHGGAAVLARFADQQRRAALRAREPLLFVHAGDLFQETRLVNRTRGACMPPMLEHLRLHLGIPGNHEWDYGPEGFARLVAAPRPLMLSTSIRGLSPRVLPRAVLDLGGHRVGFVAYTLPETREKAPPGATDGLDFREGPEALRGAVEGFRRPGVSWVLVLSHTVPSQDEELARTLDPDLMITGHTDRVVPPRLVEGTRTWYVQGGSRLRQAGWLRLELDPETGRAARVEGEVVELDPERYRPVPETARLVEKLREEAGITGSQATVELQRPLYKGIWSADSPALRVLAQAMLEASGADVALINPGAFRAPVLGPGPVGEAEIYAAAPYENHVAIVTMTGAELDRLYESLCSAPFRPFEPARLERYARQGLPLVAGRFLADSRGIPQPAGFVVRLDPDRPPGDRVRLETPEGDPLPQTRSLRVATSDFLARGGDGYPGLAAAPREILPLLVNELALERLMERGDRAPDGPGALVNLSLVPGGGAAAP